MNNLSQSVATNQNNSKVTAERKTRQASYRSKFGNRPHMIITKEDFKWLRDKPNSVKDLFIDCWIADPYGSRPMQLNHSLSSGSFKRAKKIISEAGLFTFVAKNSEHDSRETVCWMVQNLHGARNNDFWLKNESQIEDHQRDLEDHQRDLEDHQRDLEDHQRSSIKSQTHTQQAIQNPSETSQERLSISSKEILKTLPQEKTIGLEARSDRFPPLGEAIASAPAPTKPKEENLSPLPTKDESSTQIAESDCPEDPQALNKKSTKALDRDYKFDRSSSEAVERAVAQNLAIEQQKNDPEYQSTSKAAFARIRAKFEAQKQKKLSDRMKRLQGDKPTWMT